LKTMDFLPLGLCQVIRLCPKCGSMGWSEYVLVRQRYWVADDGSVASDEEPLELYNVSCDSCDHEDLVLAYVPAPVLKCLLTVEKAYRLPILMAMDMLHLAPIERPGSLTYFLPPGGEAPPPALLERAERGREALGGGTTAVLARADGDAAPFSFAARKVSLLAGSADPAGLPETLGNAASAIGGVVAASFWPVLVEHGGPIPLAVNPRTGLATPGYLTGESVISLVALGHGSLVFALGGWWEKNPPVCVIGLVGQGDPLSLVPADWKNVQLLGLRLEGRTLVTEVRRVPAPESREVRV